MIGSTREAHRSKGRAGEFVDVLKPGDFERNANIVERRHCLQKMKGLKHETDPSAPQTSKGVLIETRQRLAKKANLTAGGRLDTGSNPDEGGFPRSGWSDNGHAFGGSNSEGDPFQNLDRT
jgi:hypothetical protein